MHERGCECWNCTVGTDEDEDAVPEHVDDEQTERIPVETMDEIVGRKLR